MRFHLGTHMPSWFELVDVPLFVSHVRLLDRKSLPRARGPWALDSGAFSQVADVGEFTTSPREYVAAVRRYRDEIGGMLWAHGSGAQSCSNCLPFALAWRDRVLEPIDPQPVQMALEVCS